MHVPRARLLCFVAKHLRCFWENREQGVDMRVYRVAIAVVCWSSASPVAWMTVKAQPAEAVYQYSVQEGDRRVYLWTPPPCARIRGLIVAFKNLTEQRWLEDPAIRSTATEECLGEVWIGDGNRSDLSADMGPTAGQAFLQTLHDLADTSEFPEIANAPVIATGHSAHGQFAWRFAQWAPERTIAAIPIKTVPLPTDLNLNGVPLLYLVGQTTEWPQYRDSRIGDRDFFWPIVRRSALNLRAHDELQEIAVAIDPGGGHFDWSDEDARVIGLFIHKVCKLRLPSKDSGRVVSPDMPPKLRNIPFGTGWLVDASGLEQLQTPAAPVEQYTRTKRDAYWVFDQSMASAIEELQGDRQSRRKQMLSFLQDDRVLPVSREGFAALRFEPDSDGETFSLHPVFLDAIPERLVGTGTPLGHGSSPIELSVITGPLVKLGPNVFRYSDSRETGTDGWMVEQAAADAEYRKAVQPAKIHFPQNTQGTDQVIKFSPVRDRRIGTKAVLLSATSDAKLPVHFYVLSGPARVDGDRLIFSEVPKGGAHRIEIHVVAYQPGRPLMEGKPAIKAAKPVQRSFFVSK